MINKRVFIFYLILFLILGFLILSLKHQIKVNKYVCENKLEGLDLGPRIGYPNLNGSLVPNEQCDYKILKNKCFCCKNDICYEYKGINKKYDLDSIKQ